MPEPTTQQEREAPCMECGMICKPSEYHPYAACLMFKACHNGDTVRGNLQAVKVDARSLPPTDAPSVRELQAKYNELLFAVARKHPGESRHETALRYIRNAEAPNTEVAALAQQEGGDKNG